MGLCHRQVGYQSRAERLSVSGTRELDPQAFGVATSRSRPDLGVNTQYKRFTLLLNSTRTRTLSFTPFNTFFKLLSHPHPSSTLATTTTTTTTTFTYQSTTSRHGATKSKLGKV